MAEQLKRLASTNIFPVLSLVAAGYFFYCFTVAVGLPPTQTIDGTSALYLALAIVFFVLPEVRKFQQTRLRETQAELSDAKDEIQDLKSETRALMSAYNGLIFSVSNATNQLMSLNTLPNPQDVKDAQRSLNAALGEETSHHQLAAEIDLFLNEEDSDFESALWDLRRVMEKELRRVLRYELASANADGSPRFLSSSALFDEFLKNYPNYGPMYNAFHYVLRVCDAVLQGRQVPENFIQEAFHMGFRILDALRQLPPHHAKIGPAQEHVAPMHSVKLAEGLLAHPLHQPVYVPPTTGAPQTAHVAEASPGQNGSSVTQPSATQGPATQASAKQPAQPSPTQTSHAA